MNQIAQIFKDSNIRMARLMKSLESPDFKPDMDVLSAAQKEAETQIRCLNVVVNMYAVASKNRRALTDMERMNIMDNTTAIDLMLEDPNFEKVKCPLRDELITRDGCLDYSGGHPEDCKGCEIGRATKAKLLPER